MTKKRNKQIHREVFANEHNKESDRLRVNPTYDDFLHFVIISHMGFWDYDIFLECYSDDLRYYNEETRKKYIEEAQKHFENWQKNKVLPEGFVPEKISANDPRPQQIFR